MNADIERVLISQEQIARRVGELAASITADHVSNLPGHGEITIVPVMTGAFIFCADLIRQIPIAMKIGLVAVSSYPGPAQESQGPRILGNQLGDLSHRHILLVDDILDSGQTLGKIIPMLRSLGPASIKTCVLLRKDRPSARAIPVDYLGFDIPDEFVVGYGLDYNDYYRNLPDIVTLKKNVLGRPA